MDQGIWGVVQDDGDGKHKTWLASSDFKHDVWMEVNGDFASIDDRHQYARHIASRLNSTIPGHKMTEQEYIDLSDLQILRVASDILDRVGCFDEPDKSDLMLAKRKLSEIIDRLGSRIPSLEIEVE